MKSTKGITAALAIAGMTWLPSASRAAEPDTGWYAGASVGRANLSLDDQTIGPEDLSDAAMSAHGGYRFGRNFAVEGSFANLGEFRYTTTTCPEVCIPEEFATEFRHSVTRLDLAVIGAVPLGEHFQVYGRVGVASTNFDTVAHMMPGVSQRKESDVSAIYGVGLRATFDSPWSVRLQWDRTSHSEFGEQDISTLWLGGEYQFGRRAP